MLLLFVYLFFFPPKTIRQLYSAREYAELLHFIQKAMNNW